MGDLKVKSCHACRRAYTAKQLLDLPRIELAGHEVSDDLFPRNDDGSIRRDGVELHECKCGSPILVDHQALAALDEDTKPSARAPKATERKAKVPPADPRRAVLHSTPLALLAALAAHMKKQPDGITVEQALTDPARIRSVGLGRLRLFDAWIAGKPQPVLQMKAAEFVKLAKAAK